MLKLIKVLAWLACVIYLIASNLYADGLDFKGDKLDEPSITIFLDKPIDPSTVKYTLNESQKQAIFNHTGVMLDSVDLISIKFAQTTCTCELLNVGIVYKNRIVIPMNWIGKNVEGRLFDPGKSFKNLYIGTPKSNINKYLFLGICILFFLSCCIQGKKNYTKAVLISVCLSSSVAHKY